MRGFVGLGSLDRAFVTVNDVIGLGSRERSAVPLVVAAVARENRE